MPRFRNRDSCSSPRLASILSPEEQLYSFLGSGNHVPAEEALKKHLLQIHVLITKRQSLRLFGLRRNTRLICSISVPPWSMERSMSTSKVTLRLERINGHMTELMEFHAESPKLRVVLIPGNPGVVSFYQSYLEALSHLFDGKANITAISHIAHTAKQDWDKGKLFSLEEQIEHKVQFVENQDSDPKVPLLLVGHSIGAHIALCVFKKLPDKVQYIVGVYPFLAINKSSSFQSLLRWFARQGLLCEALSYFAGFVGQLPKLMSRGLVSGIIGRGWSPVSVNVACQYLLQYSVVRNFSYMGMTEFRKLQTYPDWAFLREKQDRISFLFGVADHWGPLTLFEEVSKQAPDLDVEIEREGHDHAFCCTEAGSSWVAAYCARIIMKVLPNLEPVCES